MDLLELQQRANVLVDKVNEYENGLAKFVITEDDYINQHVYCDVYCLRAVMQLLFGSTTSEKLDRTLNKNSALKLFASIAPAWNTSFKLNSEENLSYSIKQTRHQFANDINMLNSCNLIVHDSYINEIEDRLSRINSGINYSYSSNIADALVTESQISNIFKWNTTMSLKIPNNTISSNRQTPGIVCYYAGNDINLNYTSTIPYNPQISTLNGVNYGTPSTYGSAYRKGQKVLPMPICSLNGSDYSQWSADCSNLYSDKQALKFFMTGLNYTRGKLESPQQIWQPDEKYGDDNLNYGYNRQGSAVYHELVFKSRRSGCKDAGVDFTSGLTTVADNDPQGLAIRTALAQQRKFFTNRPWFKELDPLVNQDMVKFANNIIAGQVQSEATEESPIVYKTDTDYINNYKLTYETYANSFNQPL